MYETESNHRIESHAQLRSDVVAAFGGLHGKIDMRTVLPWGEHCTECVWPTCYTSCDLYSPRTDGGCRRFVDGMVRVDCPESANGYLLKIRFKQWGKLWTSASLNLYSPERAAQLEKKDYLIGTAIYELPVPNSLKKLAITKRYGWKKRQANKPAAGSSTPGAFVIECYNPAQQPIDLSLTMRPAGVKRNMPYQKLIVIRPGYQVVRIPYQEISTTVALSEPFSVELIPSGFGDDVTLYFGLLDFVVEKPQPTASGPTIKCIVWDLDNTLWDGVLVEDGLSGVALKPGIQAIIEELDRRGVLQSIASKNNEAEALRALQHFGMSDYFLYPQISWGPKGEAVKAIAAKLNIGVNSLLFVDDQEFERQQVRAACDKVRIFDSKDYLSLLEMEALKLPVTAESANRRKMYKVEQERQDVQAGFKDDYKAFLKHCKIRARVNPMSEANLERVHELTQRTNQMNFSGNRYDREVLRQILSTTHLETYVLDCEDQFGKYGIVGFGIVDKREPRLTDLMFSCRIQSKRVEHAFLRAIIAKHQKETGRDFHANYRKTERNLASGRVFEDLGLVELGEQEGVTRLMLPYGNELPDDGVIDMELAEQLIMAGER